MGRISLRLVWVLVAVPSVAAAQAGSGWELGVTLGLTPYAAEGFRLRCPSGNAQLVGMRLGVPLVRRLRIEAGIDWVVSPSWNACDVILEPMLPLPDRGPFTRHEESYDPGVVGYPFGAGSIRVVVVPWESPRQAVRLSGGVARAFEKSVNILEFGAAFVHGRGQFRFILEGEGWWYRLPRTILDRHYLDGTLVSTDSWVQHEATLTPIFRTGILIRW